MKLSGDRNQCQGCKEFFNSTFSFDKHRAGEHGKNRHCLSIEEMEGKGMAKNAAGFWVSSLQPGFHRSGTTDLQGDIDAYHESSLPRWAA